MFIGIHLVIDGFENAEMPKSGFCTLKAGKSGLLLVRLLLRMPDFRQTDDSVLTFRFAFRRSAHPDKTLYETDFRAFSTNSQVWFTIGSDRKRLPVDEVF
jgi:hypothetical protein